MKSKPGKRMWNNIQNIDLNDIKKKVRNEKHWSQSEVNEYLMNYRQFLWLLGMRIASRLVPTAEIDSLWHAHILDTKKYHRDCKIAFGRFIHHRPDYTVAKRELRRNIQLTERLFEARFGTKLGFSQDTSYGGAICVG